MEDYAILEESYTFHRVPEPRTLALTGLGLLGTLVYRRRFGGSSTASRQSFLALRHVAEKSCVVASDPANPDRHGQLCESPTCRQRGHENQ